MVFEQNNHRLTSNKYHIWNQHKKLSLPMYVWNCFGDFHFRRNFYLWSPTATGICEKINLIRTNILAVIHGFLCPQTTFHNFRTFHPFSKSLFHSSYIFTYSWGGPQVKIWPKKSRRNNFKQTWVDSGFCLIPNMVLVWSETGIILFENHRILVKNDWNWVPWVVLEQKWFIRHRISSWK